MEDARYHGSSPCPVCQDAFCSGCEQVLREEADAFDSLPIALGEEDDEDEVYEQDEREIPEETSSIDLGDYDHAIVDGKFRPSLY